MSYLAVGQVLFRLYKKDSSSLSVGKWPRAVLVCSFCAVFATCAASQSVQQRAAKPPETVSTQPSETAPLVYYAGVDQLVVYSEPRSSASPVTRLSLHQKVYRSKIEKGYAYIKVEGSGVTGWVDNARLIWRLPSQQQKAPTKTEEQAAKPAQEAPLAKKKVPTPATAAGAAEPEPTPTAAEAATEQQPTSPVAAPTSVPPAPSAPAAPAAPRPIGPSIFNPF